MGLLFTRFWHGRVLAGVSKWVQGLVYGLAVGLFLNVVFLPIMQQGFFGSEAIGATAPQEIAQSLYGKVLAPFGLPVWLDMFVLSIVFGLVLVYLLPWYETANTTAPAGTVEGEQAGMGRRDFTRALGGGAVAIVGGAVLWGVIRKALEAPTVAGVQEVDVVTDTPVAGTPTSGISATATSVPGTAVAGVPPTTVANAPGTSTTVPNTPEVGAAATSTPEAAAQATPDKFAGVKPKLVPEITPVDNFYITTKNFVDPTVDGNSLDAPVHGPGGQPLLDHTGRATGDAPAGARRDPGLHQQPCRRPLDR